MINLKQQWYFLEEPINNQSIWKILFNLKLKQATHIEFTVASINKKIPKKFEAFNHLLEEKFTSTIRYGAKRFSILDFGRVLYLRYILKPDLIRFIQKTNNLFSWMDDLPEDPALYSKQNLLLWTISHEGYIFIKLNEREKAELQKKSIKFEKCDDCPQKIR